MPSRGGQRRPPVQGFSLVRAAPILWLVLPHRPEATLLDAVHQLRLIRPSNASLLGLAECFGMKIMAALLFGLGLLDPDAVLVRPGIPANASHLPRDLHPGHSARDPEP